MTLASFQQALCELIASPDLCLSVRSDAGGFLERYDLSQRERDRLRELVWQRGMATSCTLYRSNRVTPIYTLLHLTCIVLGEQLKGCLEEYWANNELLDLEFKQEIQRFACFVRRKLANGEITDPFVEEVLEFELALSELRFAPRRQILARLRQASAANAGGYRLHPLMRVVRFRHTPSQLLEALAQGRVPRELPEEDAFMLLNQGDDELSAAELDGQTGRLLWRIQAEGSRPEDDVTMLVESAILCSAATWPADGTGT